MFSLAKSQVQQPFCIVVQYATQCSSAAAAKVVAEELAAYQTRQYELYSSYSPEGAARIQAAVIEQKGAWAVYVAADDAASAQSILNKYFG